MTKELICKIFNGVFTRLTTGSQELLLEAMNEVGIDNPLIISLLGYQSITKNNAIEVLKIVFNFYKKYYDTPLNDTGWEIVVDEGNKLAQGIESEAERKYFTKVLSNIFAIFEENNIKKAS